MVSSDFNIIISAERRERFRQFFRDLIQYRELFLSFVERDIKVRYKQTALGVVWVILQPLFLTGAFAIIFSRMGSMPTDGLPTVLFYLAANVPWTAFASAVTQSGLSMEANAAVITKVYFPRVVLPAAMVCGTLIDFAIGWCILNVVAMWMGYWHWQLVALTPLLLLIQLCTATGIGLVLAVLNAQYRDVKHTIGFLVQALLLVTPVIYPLSKLPAWAQDYAFINPMAIVISAYRIALQGGPQPWLQISLSLLTALAFLLIGLWFFRKMEVRMADIL